MHWNISYYHDTLCTHKEDAPDYELVKVAHFMLSQRLTDVGTHGVQEHETGLDQEEKERKEDKFPYLPMNHVSIIHRQKYIQHQVS